MKLLANVAPAPSDVVWQNTYISRFSRMLRAWTITLVIAILTVFWSLLLVPLAGLLSLENIGKVWPQLADALSSHDISRSLVQQGLPTLLISLLSVAVPYLYYCMFRSHKASEPKLMKSRAVHATRHDVAGRCRIVAYIQKLLLYILQPLYCLYHLWNSLECSGVLQPHRRVFQRHDEHCINSSHFPPEPGPLLYQLDHTSRAWAVSLSIA